MDPPRFEKPPQKETPREWLTFKEKLALAKLKRPKAKPIKSHRPTKKEIRDKAMRRRLRERHERDRSGRKDPLDKLRGKLQKAKDHIAFIKEWTFDPGSRKSKLKAAQERLAQINMMIRELRLERTLEDIWSKKEKLRRKLKQNGKMRGA